MRLLFVADGRSPIALNWISHFIARGYEVHLVSTFPCDAIMGLSSLTVIPGVMNALYRFSAAGQGGGGNLARQLFPVGIRTRLRQMYASLSLARGAKSVQEVIENIQPELVHAMRIPYEGMLASAALHRIETQPRITSKPPILASVWGNDFTLHARSSRALNELTRKVLSSIDALHTDCQRDQKLAVELGFNASKPAIVLPGNGGVRLDIFYPSTQQGSSQGQITIINPRGFRAYVRNDTFFNAIPLVLERHPAIRFICPGMAGEGQAERWIADLGLAACVDLLPRQSPSQMADLFRKSQVMLSITTHDGTPNTLLEGMASGCFPIVGDVESLREWITDGENGLLVDPGDIQALADAILEAIKLPELRRQAKDRNLQLVEERAEHGEVMRMAEAFYQEVVSQAPN